MQHALDKLPPNLVLLILVIVWAVPLLIIGIVGFVRLQRVYRGLQMPVYPGKRNGELFDWAPGPKTASAAKYSFFGSLLYSLFLVWTLVRMHLSDSNFGRAFHLAGWVLAVGIPIHSYVRWKRFARKSPPTDNSFQVSGAARK
jgi:hypothetical protein